MLMRAATAVTGVHPEPSSAFANEPDVPNAAHETMAMMRPMLVWDIAPDRPARLRVATGMGSMSCAIWLGAMGEHLQLSCKWSKPGTPVTLDLEEVRSQNALWS